MILRLLGLVVGKLTMIYEVQTFNYPLKEKKKKFWIIFANKSVALFLVNDDAADALTHTIRR